MKRTLLPPSRTLALLLIAVLCLAGNSRAGWFTWSTDLTVNGRRTITRSKDDVTRKLETTNHIDIQDGHITKFDKGSLIKLEQTGGPQQRQAELRDSDGKLELWIKDDKGFHKGGVPDQQWLDAFLFELTKKSDSDQPPQASPAPSPAGPADAKTAKGASPTGTWRWSDGSDVVLKDDHTAAWGDDTGTWKWTNEAKGELAVAWKGDEGDDTVDTLTLSENGNHLQGRNKTEDVSGYRLNADGLPADSAAAAGTAAFCGTDPDSPLGVWHWFVGRDEIFHADGTVTYPSNYATWKWVDQAKRTLVVEWKTLPFVDKLTLSKDGQRLEGTNQGNGDRESNAVTAERVISPLGQWKMNKGAAVTFRENHAAAFDDEDAGFWYWLDESKRQFRVEWYTIPYVDTMTVAEDGKSLSGSNHKGDQITGARQAGPIPVPIPAKESDTE